MKGKDYGFGLIELMIALLIGTVIMIGVYKFWTNSMKEMSSKISQAAVKQNADLVFNSIVNDLRLIGYNPRDLVDATTNRPLFNITNHPNPYDSIAYSFYNADTTCVNTDITSCTSNPPVAACNCTRYRVLSGNLIKSYFNTSTNPPAAADMTLARNSCLRLLYWDSVNNAPSIDQATQPTALKLILSVAYPAGSKGSLSTSPGTFSIDGCLTNGFCCDIPQPSPNQTKPDYTRYVKYEKKIYLSNLR